VLVSPMVMAAPLFTEQEPIFICRLNARHKGKSSQRRSFCPRNSQYLHVSSSKRERKFHRSRRRCSPAVTGEACCRRLPRAALLPNRGNNADATPAPPRVLSLRDFFYSYLPISSGGTTNSYHGRLARAEARAGRPWYVIHCVVPRGARHRAATTSPQGEVDRLLTGGSGVPSSPSPPLQRAHPRPCAGTHQEELTTGGLGASRGRRSAPSKGAKIGAWQVEPYVGEG
jgi:hypothetical protein